MEPKKKIIMKDEANQLLTNPFLDKFEHQSFDLEYEFVTEIFLDESKSQNHFVTLLRDPQLKKFSLPEQRYILHSLYSPTQSISLLSNEVITQAYFIKQYNQNIFHFNLLERFTKLLLSSPEVPDQLKEHFQANLVTTPYYWEKFIYEEVYEGFYEMHFYAVGSQADYYGLAKLRGIEKIVKAFDQINYGLFYMFNLYEVMENISDNEPKLVARIYTDYLLEKVIVCFYEP